MKEKIATVKTEMEQLLQASKRATESGDFDKAERKDLKVFAMERTLNILGYSVIIDTEKCKVTIS